MQSLALARRFEDANPEPNRLGLSRRRGAATTFGTTNDETNAPMRGINARLGYVVAPPVIEVEKVFAPPSEWTHTRVIA